jgi:hypothetical protein
MTESYEQLRDGATGDGGDAWRAADRETGKLYALYRELKEDPRYSDDYKAEKAWAVYDANKAKIEAKRERAREHLEKQARSGERFSIPMPPGKPSPPRTRPNCSPPRTRPRASCARSTG